MSTLKFVFFTIFLLFLSGNPLWGQESRLVLFSGNPEKHVQSFDTLIYEHMTSMTLKIANIGDFEKYDWLRLILTCKLGNGGRKALQPKKYYAQLEMPLAKSSLKGSDSIHVIVFDEKGHSHFDEKMKIKLRNFSLSPTRRRWLEYWATYEYRFKLYGFQKSNDTINTSDNGNSSEKQQRQGDVLGMSNTFHVRSIKRKRPRVGGLLFLRQFFEKE
jgi:hypothetical protein